MMRFLRCFSLVFLGVMTACGGGGSSTSTSAGSKASIVLQSISVTASNPSFAAGLTQQITATGSYSDGSTKDITATAAWTTSNSHVATISTTGVVKAMAPGSCSVIATVTAVSGNASVTVAPATLNSISINASAPIVAAGYTDQFTASGSYSDGSTQNLTSSATWTVSNGTVAAISTTGLATAKAKGSAVITATVGSVSGTGTLTVGSAQLVSIAVSSSTSSVGVGYNEQFLATGTFSDGSAQDISNAVTWNLSNPSLAVISSSGLLHATTNGSETVTATSGTISGATPFTITISLVSIVITPIAKTIAPGTDEQFKATGTFTDGSTQDVTGTVTWGSSNKSNVAISNSVPTNGLAQALHSGISTITATSGNISAPSATLTVSSATLSSIAITPAAGTIPLGVLQQFTAKGTFSDGSVQDITNTVTWTSSQPSFASITVSGEATGRNLGTTSITAVSGSVTGTTTLTVNAANLVSLAIQPAGITIAQGTTSKLSAIGTFNDGSTRDVSAQATWTSSATGVATVQTNGKLQGISQGSATATAVLGSQSSSVNVNVTNATAVSISVTPSVSTVASGTQVTYSATALFNDSSTQVISSNVAWSSSDNTVATVSNLAGTRGIASTQGSGNAIITATFEGVSGSAQLNVTGANLTGINVTPASAVLAPASTQQYVATATYDDGSSQNVSTLVTWTSSATSIATVTGFGQAMGQSSGTATITASMGGASGTSTVLVESSALTSITVTPAASTVPEQIMSGFTALGSFADGSSQDLTSAATWTSSNAAAATVSNAAGTRGIATGVAPGTSTISAVFAGEVGTSTMTVTNATLVSIAITPASPIITLGSTQDLVATGTFSDGSTLNLSTQVAWSSSNVNVAVVNAQGLATSVSSGTSTITATLNGVTTTAVLTVN